MAKYKYKGTIIEANSRCEALEQAVGGFLTEDRPVSLNVDRKPKIIDIRSKMPSKKSNGIIKLADIKYAVIHHDGNYRPLFYNSQERYRRQAQYHIDSGLNHIAYNYSIDNVGDIFYLSTIGEIGYHAGNWPINKASIAIKLDGDLTKQGVTKKQLKAYQDLCWWLTNQRPDVPNLLKQSWRRHGQVRIGGTACPGVIDILDF